MSIEWTVVGILAVWRMTHLLALEDGPFDLVFRLRRALGASQLGRMMDCFYCLSVWVALAVLAAMQAVQPAPSLVAAALLWLALSGGAVLLERATDRGASEGNAIIDDVSKEN
jgi:hypothetical protein